MSTLTSLQAGNPVIRFVICVDGYPHLLSDAPQAAVQTAWAGTDFATTTVIPNVIVQLENQQQIDPWNTFMGGGRCTIRVQPDDSDTLGIDMHRTDAGAETSLSATVDRNQSLQVAFNSPFDYAGEAHIGTECFGWRMLGGGKFDSSNPTRTANPNPFGTVVSTRGKYVAAGCKDSVAVHGSTRFAEHHRVVTQDNGVQLRPIVSQYPRSWKGRRVSVWMHTWDESTQSLNTKANALCVFIGTLTEIRDDAGTGDTVLLVEHELDRIKNAVIGRDMWAADLAYGHRLTTGMKFQFQDFNGTSWRVANSLTVVASGAADANHINAGWYSIEEIASAVNRWIQCERTQNRLYGNYTLNCPEDVAGQPRTVMHFYIPGSATVSWRITWPSSSWGYALGYNSGSQYNCGGSANASHEDPSPLSPSPGTIFGWDANGTLQCYIENQTGTFIGQYGTLPAAVRATMPANGGTYGNNWGLFVLEGETPFIFSAAVVGTQLRYIQSRTAAFGTTLSGIFQAFVDGTLTIPWGGAAPRIRQIFCHAGPAKTLLKWLTYSTGTPGYNEPTFDILPYGQGLNIPYDYLGSTFETSCDSLPGANDILTITIDKPKKFSEILGNDLLLRTAHLVYRAGTFQFMSWTTPSSALATVSLGESTKAAPAGTKDPHRTASVLDGSWVRNLIKINYNRDLLKTNSGGDAVYNSAPIIIEDATSVDDQGGVSAPVTLDLINVYGDTDEVSQGVKALAKNLTAWFPWFSRPVWKVTRSISLPYFEGFGVGDIVAYTDPFVRDPTTGRRGITNRPGIVIRHRYSIETSRPPNKIKFGGEIDIVFLNVDRTNHYSPTSHLDDLAAGAGYDGSLTLTWKRHEFSELTETVDIGRFSVNDWVRIIEVDPADPANPDSWLRQIATIDTANTQCTLTASLSSPAFNSSKKYRMIPASYTTVQTSQKTGTFQASGNTRTIQETVPAHQYGSTSGLPWWGVGNPTLFDHTRTPELPANISYGPEAGAPRDSGYEKELCLLAENLMDHKTALSSPVIGLATRTCKTGDTPTNDDFYLLRVEELFIGDLLHGQTAERYLYLGPRWRSFRVLTYAFQSTLRITISGYPPSGSTKTGSPSTISSATIKGPSASNSWYTNADGTWVNSPERAYPLSTFNKHQFVYLIVEGNRIAEFWAIHTLRMSERVEPDPLYVRALQNIDKLQGVATMTRT